MSLITYEIYSISPRPESFVVLSENRKSSNLSSIGRPCSDRRHAGARTLSSKPQRLKECSF